MGVNRLHSKDICKFKTAQFYQIKAKSPNCFGQICTSAMLGSKCGELSELRTVVMSGNYGDQHRYLAQKIPSGYCNRSECVDC